LAVKPLKPKALRARFKRWCFKRLNQDIQIQSLTAFFNSTNAVSHLTAQNSFSFTKLRRLENNFSAERILSDRQIVLPVNDEISIRRILNF
jgi:hypothetical protein